VSLFYNVQIYVFVVFLLNIFIIHASVILFLRESICLYTNPMHMDKRVFALKNSLKKCVFVNSALKIQNTVPYCQKYTPTDCVFGDFAHWAVIFCESHSYKVLFLLSPI